MNNERHWDGKTVHVVQLPSPPGERRNVEVSLTPETAHQLALLLRGNTGLGSVFTPLTDGVQELLNALDYVLVADPASVAAHRRMEAGKGMTPDGGHKAPPAPPWVELRRRSHGSLDQDGE